MARVSAGIPETESGTGGRFGVRGGVGYNEVTEDALKADVKQTEGQRPLSPLPPCSWPAEEGRLRFNILTSPGGHRLY
jgi:hypothetical protein